MTKLAPRKRKAWVYAPPKAPPLAALWAKGDERRKFLRYWFTEHAWGALHLFTHFALKLLPMDAASAFGASLGRFATPRYHKTASRRMRETIARLCPDLSAAEQEAIYIRNCEAQGRFQVEFSKVERLRDHMYRIEVRGIDKISQAAKRGPIILVGLHLGNLEISPLVLSTVGIKPFLVYMPPKDRSKLWIAIRTRLRCGFGLLDPGARAMRMAVAKLKESGAVMIFCDEGFGGKLRGPFFGRKPHQEGNIARAVRLARLTGATICPWYTVRTEGFRFVWHTLDPIILPPEGRPGERLVEDLLFLNDSIEPAILQHLDQWYFLHHSISDD